jgi:hypothetical protein
MPSFHPLAEDSVRHAKRKDFVDRYTSFITNVSLIYILKARKGTKELTNVMKVKCNININVHTQFRLK